MKICRSCGTFATDAEAECKCGGQLALAREYEPQRDWWRIVAYVGLASISIFLLYNVLAPQTGEAPTVAAEPAWRPPTRSAPPPPPEVTAADLFAAYEANEVAADLQFKGSEFLVNGTIANIGKDILDTPYVTLETGSRGIGTVQCMFPKNKAASLATLRKGQKIGVLGTGSGKLMNVIVTGCRLWGLP